MPNTDDIHEIRAEDTKWADLLALSALRELDGRFPEEAKLGLEALLRKHPEAAPPLPAAPAPPYSPWGQDRLRAGEPVAYGTVWFVNWPHNLSGDSSPHPAVLLPLSDTAVLLLRTTSRTGPRAGEDTRMTLRHPKSTGLRRNRKAAVVTDRWCLTDPGSLREAGVLCGRLSLDDSRKVRDGFLRAVARFRRNLPPEELIVPPGANQSSPPPPEAVLEEYERLVMTGESYCLNMELDDGSSVKGEAWGTTLRTSSGTLRRLDLAVSVKSAAGPRPGGLLRVDARPGREPRFFAAAGMTLPPEELRQPLSRAAAELVAALEASRPAAD